MTLADAINSVRITEVWGALGGGQLRHGRGQAFWRDGDGFNVSLTDAKGAWHDFATGAHGGILDLIQTVLSLDRAAAVRWIGSTLGLEINSFRPPTRAEKRRYARARSEAERFISWRSRRLEELRDERNYHFRDYHKALRLILVNGLDNPDAEQWIESHDIHERGYQELDQQIDAFAIASFESLIPQFQKAELRPVERRTA